MRSAVMMIAALLAGPSRAEGWRDLTGVAIQGALQQHQVLWDDGSAQVFISGGVTYFIHGWLNEGRWRASEDGYCSQWPPNMDWVCYDVQAGSGGRVRFLGPEGRVWEGQIVDKIE